MVEASFVFLVDIRHFADIKMQMTSVIKRTREEDAFSLTGKWS